MSVRVRPAPFLAACLLTLLVLPAGKVVAQTEFASRIWTDVNGKEVEGAILGLEDNQIRLKTAQGTFEFSIDRLSEADRDFARQWKADQAKPAAENPKGDKGLGNFENLKLGEWPDLVEAELDVSEIEELGEVASRYVYRSPNFEFRSSERLSRSVVREFSRIFEATFRLVKEMPLGLDPRPSGEGYYLTYLYGSMSEYAMNGGPPGSGGFFRHSPDEQYIGVPLQSLGVRSTGTRFIVDHDRESDTLVHEIAHQVMYRWLPVTPVWLTEGIAEVVSSQGFSSNRFRLTSMDRAIKDAVTRGRGDTFYMTRPSSLMTMSHEEWARDLTTSRGSMNYSSANLLAYYFMRLEGEGNGKAMVDYLKALSEKTPEDEARDTHLLKGRGYEELEGDVLEAWRGLGLKIEFR